nr:glycosyltransferase [Acetobacter garciniae]
MEHGVETRLPLSGVEREKTACKQAALSASYRASAQLQALRAQDMARYAATMGPGPRGFRSMVRAGPKAAAHRIWHVLRKINEIYRVEGPGGIGFRLSHRLGLVWDRACASSGGRLGHAGRSGPSGQQGPTRHTAQDHASAMRTLYLAPLPPARMSELAPRMVLIAELSLRQCAKYRVWQKEEQLRALGWQVEVVDWRHTEQALSAMQVGTGVIFYRVPAFPAVETLLAEARRLGLSPWWEVDDLIFSASDYRANGNLDTLGSKDRAQLLFGVRLFRSCLLACNGGIASTRALARAMRRAGMAHVAVIENALDRQTLALAAQILAAPPARPGHGGEIRIVYGSGTNTHDADFRHAAPGILAAMQAEPRLSLHIIGELSIPESFQALGARVQHRPGLDFAGYMGLLAQADISIAPLEPTVFNDAKSAIKFLEAGILAVPSICSGRDAFHAVIRPGENGLLAETEQDWCHALLRLAADAPLRRQLGQQARRDVLARFSPDAITRTQVEPVFGRIPPPGPNPQGLRVLCANLYYAPQSFGGATVVAEETARHLSRQPHTWVSVFTSRPDLPGRGGAAVRYVAHGLDTLAVSIAPGADPIAAIDNAEVAQEFTRWVEATRPDIVHFHAMQGLGLGCVRVCMEKAIPYAITLHDAWWLCARQFMVQGDGRVCSQAPIDLRLCQICLPQARYLQARQDLMHAALQQAALLLAPSESHRALYVANGIPPARIRVNRNGFAWPARPRSPRPAQRMLRFGYVGGADNVKGYTLLRRAFESLARDDWELVLVDNTLNLGLRSLHAQAWRVRGRVEVVPAYTQAGMDDFYDGLDVLLCPSQCHESYGLSVREALARNVWVVTTRAGGQAEDVTDGVNGTLIALDGRAETLRCAVESILASPTVRAYAANPDRARLSTFARQSAELGQWLREAAGKAHDPAAGQNAPPSRTGEMHPARY